MSHDSDTKAISTCQGLLERDVRVDGVKRANITKLFLDIFVILVLIVGEVLSRKLFRRLLPKTGTLHQKL